MTTAEWIEQQLANAPAPTQQQIADLRRIFVPVPDVQKKAS